MIIKNFQNFILHGQIKKLFTKFLNTAINKKIIDLYYLKTDKFWMEIDSEKDLSVAENVLRTNSLIEQNMQLFFTLINSCYFFLFLKSRL